MWQSHDAFVGFSRPPDHCKEVQEYKGIEPVLLVLATYVVTIKLYYNEHVLFPTED